MPVAKCGTYGHAGRLEILHDHFFVKCNSNALVCLCTRSASAKHHVVASSWYGVIHLSIQQYQDLPAKYAHFATSFPIACTALHTVPPPQLRHRPRSRLPRVTDSVTAAKIQGSRPLCALDVLRQCLGPCRPNHSDLCVHVSAA